MSFLLREYTKRAGLLLGGLLISAVGITMTLQANIGLEPWSVLQSGMSIFFGMTYGTAAMIVGAVVIAVAIACGESFGAGTIANIFFCPYMVRFHPELRQMSEPALRLCVNLQPLRVHLRQFLQECSCRYRQIML